MIFKIITFLFASFTFLHSQQESGQEYRRSAIHNGNLVKTVFGNWGVVGQPAYEGPRGAWINENNGYVGDVSLLVGAEVTAPNSDGEAITFHSVVVCPVDRPVLGGMEQSLSGTPWGFEPVAGYMNENQESIAMSTNPLSWPSSWPDKELDWNGQWNGFFGQDIQNIQQESFYVMNDNNDQEFNFSQNNQWGVEFKPDINNPMLNGLGLEVKVRGMQWGQFLAQDCIFWLYEITNTSATDYSKVVFGELVGTYVGATGTDDSAMEYNDDWSFFDVNENIAYTGDFDNDCSSNPNWVGDVGMVGYAFLESPGNPYDGIDNDGDATTIGGAPLFAESDFDSTVVENGDNLIVIDENYNRQILTISQNNGELVSITTLGAQIDVIVGETVLSEGNLIDQNGEISINTNAYDGIDNDLDGLIDENYFLHYRQRKEDQDGNVLFDILSPKSYIDYLSGFGSNNSMIDESRDDGVDNDGDWDSEYDDVGQDGLSNTGDIGENNGFPDAGEPNFDQTDPDESDQIGLSSFDYFVPANNFPHSDDEAIWDRLAPGFFDVPSSISNGIPISGEDGDFIFSSGYFPLKAGQTERFSVALLYGENQADLLSNKQTVQSIYDQDYRFPPPPTKPTLHAVAGNQRVTLYWDRIAEEEEDPVLKEYDFQGYKIYRATDPNFNDVRNITNANGVIEGYSPIAQFDLKDSIDGYFYPTQELFESSQGYTFFLGDSTGLVHQYVDHNVQNGRTYYYAVVAYDNGDPQSMFPAENSKLISVLSSGEILTDQNTAYATPSSKSAGYSISDVTDLEHYGPATGTIAFNLIDEKKLTGNEYELTFFDTSTDMIDNDLDDLVDESDDEYVPITTFYNILNLSEVNEEIVLSDTSYYYLQHKNISVQDFSLEDLNGTLIEDSKYELDSDNGKIRFLEIDNSLSLTTLKVKYLYYPILKSPYIQDSPWISESYDSDVFDGLTLQFVNDWNVNFIDSKSYWVSDNDQNYIYSLGLQDADWLNPTIIAKAMPNDYVIIFEDEVGVSSSLNLSDFPDAVPTDNFTNFSVFDLSNQRNVPYLFTDNGGDGLIRGSDIIYFYEKDSNEEYHYTWNVSFYDIDTQSPVQYNYGNGDSLFISVTKPFSHRDTLYFQSIQPFVDNDLASNELANIRVVPNPYIAATKFESPLPPGVTSGRGERKIEFQNLPSDALIKIFTSRGQHVKTLYHEGDIHSGTVSWDLKTKENLDIAYGVYFYIVQSDFGSKKGKLAIIK